MRPVEWLTIGQAATILQLDRSTLRRYVDRGVLEARVLPLSGRRQVTRSSVDQLLIDMREVAVARADDAEVAS
jgi:predicted site-specific integrase-resolvase